METNEKLIEFWNDLFAQMKPDEVKDALVGEESFNNLVNDYFPKKGTIVDLACGSGWGSFDYCSRFKEANIIAIDTSKNAIDYIKECIKLSNIKNLEAYCGDESILSTFKGDIDALISVNLIDVVDDVVIDKILKSVSENVKKDGTIIFTINPEFPCDFLEKLGYKTIDKYLYKDNILRGNLKTDEEWIKIFSSYFNFLEERKFSVIEKEREHPRRAFICKNR